MKTFQLTVFCSFLIGSTVANAGTPIIDLKIGGEISPGVYGQVRFGNAPPPPVVYAQPKIIVQQPPNTVVEPLYVHVPPGHAKDWANHCREYDACNRPVYFVRSAEYEPGYRAGKDKKHREDARRESGRRDEGRREEGLRDEGRREEGQRDQGRREEGQRNEGRRDEGRREEGQRDEGRRSEGSRY